MAARKKTTKKSTKAAKKSTRKTAKKSIRKTAKKPSKKTAKKSTRRTAKKSPRKAEKKAVKKNAGKKRSSQSLVELDERLDKIGRKLHAARIHAKYKAANTKEDVKAKSVQAKAWVKENPGKAVAGAAFFGWITSKLFGRKR